MKKMIVVLAAVAALSAVAAAPASAGRCQTVKCFNKQIAVLHSEVAQLSAGLDCLQPMAMTRYGGYDYNGNVGATTALDLTGSGDAVTTWVVSIEPGTCGAPQTRAAASSASGASGTAARGASPFGPFQAFPAMTSDETKVTQGGSR